MKKKTSITKIINTVAQFYKVPSSKLRRKSRKAKYTRPRQITMYLLREELNRSYPYIGRLFGSRDHTTVIYAHKKITNMIQNSPQLRSELEQIKNMLYNHSNKGQNNDERKLGFEKEESKNVKKENRVDKRERFKRLAVYRTNEVLRKLKILGNCANRSAYSYTEEEVNKIFLEIERKLKEVKAKFHFPKEKKFKL